MLFSECSGERKQPRGGVECGPPARPGRVEMTEELGDTGTTPLKEPTQTSAFNITEAHLTTFSKMMCALMMLSSLCMAGI